MSWLIRSIGRALLWTLWRLASYSAEYGWLALLVAMLAGIVLGVCYGVTHL